jgi:putative nucleotidyltransferase with HDIG domain
LQYLDRHPDTDLVALIDLNLQDMGGLVLIGEMHARNPLLIPIIITGDATTDTALHCLRNGAYDFIQKPVRQGLLKSTLERAMEYSRLRRENRVYHQDLANLTRQKTLDLDGALQRTRESFDFTLRAMTAMMDAREHFTGSHSIRVQEITVMMARKYNFNDHELDGIRHGALLHDIGKIALPDRILLKAGALNDEERQIMRQHVEIGYELIKPNRDLQGATDIMLCHHENFDGSGYPKGLREDDIPLAARIFSVVDSYDAMRSTRPYRVGMPRQAAIAELQCNSGTQFDPAVVRVFLQNIEAVEAMGKWDQEHQAKTGVAQPGQAIA